ncbi:MAG: N-acetyl-alpha-D-glucosaminyl L-malate synthase BshA [Nitrospirae bacterium]|nr:N-acetyl-alpha-D-glucosaminyl L-malate synthase BshA [Nitrospirota bacterium]
MEFQLQTPVAFLVFNRPDTTQQVFAEIRRARPPKLLVIADGPRPDRPDDAEKCRAVRALIEQVDWPCEVLKNYSDVNLGCKRRVSSGLDWVFDTVEEAIILEDDCLPDPTFFRFCQTLLEKYRDDERVMMISGDNFQFGRNRTGYSYYFSRYTHIWGWASWRRAWKHYDVSMDLWPVIRDERWLEAILDGPATVRYWRSIFERVHNGAINTWDYQWTFATWIQNGLVVLPEVNLVTNIGFGQQATHTASASRFSNMATSAMHFPLSYPAFVLRDANADDYTWRTMFRVQPLVLIKQLYNKIRGF